MFERHQILRRLKLNVSANSFGFLVSILHQVASVPIYLAYWPKELYGEWLVLSALPIYLGLTDLGLGVVASKRMSIAMGKGDLPRATATLHTAWGTQAIGLLLIFLLSAAAIFFGNPSHWFDIHLLSLQTVRWCLFLLIVRTLLVCQIGIYRAIYDSTFLAARGIMVSHMARFLEFIVIVMCIPAGFGVIGLSVALLVAQVLLTFYMYIDTRRHCCQFRLGWQHFRKEEVTSCVRDGVAFQMIPFTNVFIIQGMTLMVNYALGASAVVVYNTTRSVCRAGGLGIQMLTSSVGSELSLLFGRGNFDDLYKIFRAVVQSVFWFSLVSAAGFFLLGGWVILLLSHGKVVAGNWLLLNFSIGLITTGLWYAISSILIATNHHRFISVMIFVLNLLLLPLSVILMKALGLPGAPLAIVLVDLLIGVASWLAVRRILPDNGTLTLGALFRFPDVTGLLKKFFGGRKPTSVSAPTESSSHDAR